ncbi:MAG: PqqD family protein [Desulfobacterales bacterium]|nr:PqqD family protein [Desulfobacterales bacterium]
MMKDEESFLFDRRNGSVYSLNQTGTFIFSLILSGKDFCTILEQMADAFDTNPVTDTLYDCNRFVGEILKLGLLTPKDAV